MIAGTSQVRATAPVSRSVFWLMVSLIAWELFQGLRAGAQIPEGPQALPLLDLAFLVLLPALCAFAFARLFLVLSQSARGTLNLYATISSPLAWVFWIGLGIAMIGHGIHLAGHALQRSMPEILAQGEFAAKIAFLDKNAGFLVPGIGFFLVTLVLLLLGEGAGQRIAGVQRLLFVLGSLATYGFILVYIAVEGKQILFAILASAVLTAVSLWNLPPSEATRDPVGALVVPGAFLAGVTLLVWAIVVGGQPTWP